MSSLKFEAFDPKHHLKDVTQLFNDVYSRRVTEREFISKYTDKLQSPFFYGWAVYDGKLCVGFHGGLPFGFELNSERETGILLADFMVRKEYQKSGLGSQLLQLDVEKARELGAGFCYGFANEKSIGPISRLPGWHVGNSFTAFIIPAYNENSPQGKWKRVMRKLFPGDLASFPRTSTPPQIIDKDLLHTTRDREFYEYKKYNKGVFLEIEGFSVWVKAAAYLCVGAMDQQAYHHLDKVVPQLVQTAGKLRCKGVLFQLLNGTQEEKAMSAVYSGIPSWKITYAPAGTTLPLEKLSFCYGDTDMF